ncbi:MAG: hypothetical protein ACI9LM_000107 [Alteromonadaceae bacterium]|jgi:hypothetical protein
MRKVILNNQIWKALKPALIGAKGTIKRELEMGISELFQTENRQLNIIIRREGLEMVLVAVAGSKLEQSRQEIINFARKNNYRTVRFHTKYPEHIEHAFSGLPISLYEVRKALFGRDELIYKLEL